MTAQEISAYAEKALKALKESPEKIAKAVQDSGFLQEVLGDDGKLTKEDLSRIADKMKDSAFAKKVLGEDGKFDSDDIQRLASAAKKLFSDEK